MYASLSVLGKKYIQNKKLPNTFNLFVQATVEFLFLRQPIIKYFALFHVSPWARNYINSNEVGLESCIKLSLARFIDLWRFRTRKTLGLHERKLVDRRGQLTPHCACVRVRGSYPEASSADVFGQTAGPSTFYQGCWSKILLECTSLSPTCHNLLSFLNSWSQKIQLRKKVSQVQDVKWHSLHVRGLIIWNLKRHCEVTKNTPDGALYCLKKIWKFVVTQLSVFTETKHSLPCLQEHDTGLSLEPGASGPNPYVLVGLTLSVYPCLAAPSCVSFSRIFNP